MKEKKYLILHCFGHGIGNTYVSFLCKIREDADKLMNFYKSNPPVGFEEKYQLWEVEEWDSDGICSPPIIIEEWYRPSTSNPRWGKG